MAVLKPLLISTKGAPLTATEYDINISRTLARENHTGQQTASTICDLDRAVSNLPVITNIVDRLTSVETKITELMKDIPSLGDVNDQINVLIQPILDLVNQLVPRISSLEERVTNLEELLTECCNGNVAVDEGRLQQLESAIVSLRTELQQEVTARIVGDNILQLQIDALRAELDIFKDIVLNLVSSEGGNIPVPLPTPTPFPVPVPVPTPTPTPFPVPNPVPTPNPVPNPIPTPTPNPIPTPVPVPNPIPTPFPVPNPIPTPNPVPTPFPVPNPIPTPTPSNNGTPNPVPTPTPFPVPVPVPNPVPTPVPFPVPTPVPTPRPVSPTPRPSLNDPPISYTEPNAPPIPNKPADCNSYVLIVENNQPNICGFADFTMTTVSNTIKTGLDIGNTDRDTGDNDDDIVIELSEPYNCPGFFPGFLDPNTFFRKQTMLVYDQRCGERTGIDPWHEIKTWVIADEYNPTPTANPKEYPIPTPSISPTPVPTPSPAIPVDCASYELKVTNNQPRECGFADFTMTTVSNTVKTGLDIGNTDRDTGDNDDDIVIELSEPYNCPGFFPGFLDPNTFFRKKVMKVFDQRCGERTGVDPWYETQVWEFAGAPDGTPIPTPDNTPTPTPTPFPVPVPIPTPSPSPFPIPVPTPTPIPSPIPTPSPSPGGSGIFAPIFSPVFAGEPAIFTNGALVPTPSLDASGNEVINADWFRKTMANLLEALPVATPIPAPTPAPSTGNTGNCQPIIVCCPGGTNTGGSTTVEEGDCIGLE